MYLVAPEGEACRTGFIRRGLLEPSSAALGNSPPPPLPGHPTGSPLLRCGASPPPNPIPCLVHAAGARPNVGAAAGLARRLAASLLGVRAGVKGAPRSRCWCWVLGASRMRKVVAYVSLPREDDRLHRRRPHTHAGDASLARLCLRGARFDSTFAVAAADALLSPRPTPQRNPNRHRARRLLRWAARWCPRASCTRLTCSRRACRRASLASTRCCARAARWCARTA